MCAEWERLERIVQNDVWSAEYVRELLGIYEKVCAERFAGSRGD